MILEGSGGLLLSKEEVEKNVANIGSNRMMNTHGEIRFAVKKMMTVLRNLFQFKA
jgi:hypothetical protein